MALTTVYYRTAEAQKGMVAVPSGLFLLAAKGVEKTTTDLFLSLSLPLVPNRSSGQALLQDLAAKGAGGQDTRTQTTILPCFHTETMESVTTRQ